MPLTEDNSLENVFVNLPKSLLLHDGIKPLFYILRSVVLDPSNPLSEGAKQILAKIESTVDSDTSYDVETIVDIIVPFLLEIMNEGDKESQKNAAWAIAILVKKGVQSDEIVPITIGWLESKDEMKVVHAAWILRNCSWAEIDISEAISSLQGILEHDDYDIRNYAAQAISNELLRSGAETKLQLFSTLMKDECLDENYWSVDVHHRKYHAISDNALPIPKYTAHFRAKRMCRNCRNANATCIFYWDDSGTGWIDRTSEYHCLKCEKYTVYHYVD